MFEKSHDDVDLPVPTVSEPNYDALERFAPLKREDYENFKEDFLTWLATKGKRPFRGDGYADSTVRTTHYKVEVAYRWLWDEKGEYTTSFGPDEAEAFIDALVANSPKTDLHEDYITHLAETAEWRVFTIDLYGFDGRVYVWNVDLGEGFAVQTDEWAARNLAEAFALYRQAVGENVSRDDLPVTPDEDAECPYCEGELSSSTMPPGSLRQCCTSCGKHRSIG